MAIKSSRDDDICRRYTAGESSLDLGRSYGITRQGVLLILKKRGIQVRPRGRVLSRELRIPDLTADYIGGKSTNSLARTYGVAQETVRRLLIFNGVSLRSPSRAISLYHSQTDR